jgi:hypothetical protein
LIYEDNWLQGNGRYVVLSTFTSVSEVLFMSLIALMMEAANTSETLLNLYLTTWRYSPKDSHLHTHRRENLKS